MSNDLAYMREYMKTRWTERRLKAVAYLGGKCHSCGSTSRLEFDHIDPSTKSFTIASGSSFSEERFWSEVDKCQLLCYDCHKKKHEAPHGTISRYRTCRCDLCREVKNRWLREYKRKKKQAVVV